MILLMLKVLLGWVLLSLAAACLWGRFVGAGLGIPETTGDCPFESQESPRNRGMKRGFLKDANLSVPSVSAHRF
jgi:hypothetical protein